MPNRKIIDYSKILTPDEILRLEHSTCDDPNNIYTIRITPLKTGYTVKHIVETFPDTDLKLSHLIIAREHPPEHLHIRLCSPLSSSSVRKILKKKYPRLVGNSHFSIHVVREKYQVFDKVLFRRDTKDAIWMSATYTCKQGNILVSQYPDLVTQFFVEIGKKIYAKTNALKTYSKSTPIYKQIIDAYTPKTDDEIHNAIGDFYREVFKKPYPKKFTYEALVINIKQTIDERYRYAYQQSLRRSYVYSPDYFENQCQLY